MTKPEQMLQQEAMSMIDSTSSKETMASTQEDESSQEQPSNTRPGETGTEDQQHSVDLPVHENDMASLVANDPFISFARGLQDTMEVVDANSDHASLGYASNPFYDDRDNYDDNVEYNDDGEQAYYSENEDNLAMPSFEVSDDNSICSNGTTDSTASEARQLQQSRSSLSSKLSCHCRDDCSLSPRQQQQQQHASTTRSPAQQQEPQGVKLRRQQSASTTHSHNKEPRSTNSSNNNIDAEPVVVLGADISHLSRPYQFLVCAAGVFGFNLSFGYLQEFVAVEICNRNLGLFLAMVQFTGYTVLSYGMRTYVNYQQQTSAALAGGKLKGTSSTTTTIHTHPKVPSYMYWGLGILSAVDMAMTNMAMHYINYPAKTLMKSSRVVFTMIFGVLMAGKRYRLVDYLVVLCMLGGLAIFMQADATSNAIFEPLGVVMLTISLLCDGATNIMSETIMKNYGVGQDELIFRMYSLALIAVTAAATFKGDLRVGMIWLSKPGTYDEWNTGVAEEEITWNVLGKLAMIFLFSSMGFFGSSCSAAITKNFGALTMSMTSTVRRAATLFISFFLFDNECTFEHVAGVVVFITALTTKSLMGRTNAMKARLPVSKVHLSPPPKLARDLEMQKSLTGEHDVSTFTNSKRKTAGPGRRAQSGKHSGY